MEWLSNHPRYQELLVALNANQAWRVLGGIGDEYSSLLSADELAQAERQPSPAHYLLERISVVLDQPLTVSDALTLLEALGGPAATAAEVLRPPVPLRVRPLTETNSGSVWAQLGGRLTLLCEAEARPAPSFLWRHDGRPVPAASGGERAQLVLEPFTAAAAGRYTCEVRDATGAAVLAGQVSVQPRQAPPRQLQRLVADDELPPDAGTVAAAGDRPLRLTVRWLGWPEPRLSWLRDDKPVAGADGPTLTVQPTDQADGATFVCVAENSVGEVRGWLGGEAGGLMEAAVRSKVVEGGG